MLIHPGFLGVAYRSFWMEMCHHVLIEVSLRVAPSFDNWGFIKNPVLSITSSGEIGFWEHDIEASKMQGRARRRKGERKTHHITSYHHITMELGGYLLNVAKNPTRARARKGEAQRVLSYQKVTVIFDNPQLVIWNMLLNRSHIYLGRWSSNLTMPYVFPTGCFFNHHPCSKHIVWVVSLPSTSCKLKVNRMLIGIPY